MKKIFFSFGIILTVCLISINIYSQTVTAYCNGTYKIIDPYYGNGGVTDTYVAALEVVTLYPTSTGVYLPVPPSPGPQTITNEAVNGVGVDWNPPIPADYYTMIVYVYKYRNGNLWERSSGSSYAWMAYISPYFYLTADNLIGISFSRP
jgi:hypothetical protein